MIRVRDWIALTLCLTVSGVLIVGLGMPLAWRIDRASYDWAEEDEGYTLPPHEMRPADPAELAEALR